MGRRQTTGRFETREELVEKVRFLNDTTTCSQNQIAANCRVSFTTVANILKQPREENKMANHETPEAEEASTEITPAEKPLGLVRFTPRPVAKGLQFAPETTEQAMEMASMLSKSTIVPTSYRGKPADTLVAMMMGAELGLNPIQSLSNISVINGKASLWGDAMLALVKQHPEFEWIKETFDKQGMEATCTAKRRGQPEHTQTFSKEDAMKAGLWDERAKVKRQRNGEWREVPNDAPWYRYQKRMLTMRARGFCLRDTFPDALLGLITAEEALDYEEETVHAEVVEEPKTQALPEMPGDQFAEAKAQFEPFVLSGKRTPAEVIAVLSTKYHLSAEQIQVINNMQPEENGDANS